ncbi:MAG: hypothetical protein M1827_003661 [Pycnora praestabilis]|nr:MAG: hypothetical protein M1827_003661 [Pycnora praestabilis]
MVAHRRKNLLASRRRVEEEGEEEGESVTVELEDDSMSEGSGLSDEEDGDADDSDISGDDVPGSRKSETFAAKVNGHAKVENLPQEQQAEVSSGRRQNNASNGRADTEEMMNGLKLSEHLDVAEEIEFEKMKEEATSPISAETRSQAKAVASKHETPSDRRKREHEEYRKQRDADPAFVPNRGGFFMHDHRQAGPGPNGFKPSGRGRGRGRAAIGGPFSPASQLAQATEGTDAPWTHDLHETVAQPEDKSAQLPNDSKQPPSDVAKSLPFGPRNGPPNRSFSRSIHIGNVQIRVYLAGMLDPIIFSAVPVKQHTRLPHHRPSLRRDKPVRISLPEQPPRYIFPAMDRSFIFIPRALRPNQQAYSRGRGRGSFGPYAGFSSRRTSAYGGSIYTPSVAMSRRSSLAREVSRDGIISPSDSSTARVLGAPTESSKPVVKLPPSTQSIQMTEDLASMEQGAIFEPTAATITLPQQQTYPLPQKPTYRENRPVPIPMHQPRPQKAVSVADIESPATLSFHPPQQQQQQPFHQQVPLQANGHPYPQDLPTYNPHSRNPSYPSQASGGTPLSQIPERAIHAQPFQPHPYQQPQGYYPQQYPAQGAYYYAPPYAPSLVSSAVAAPIFVPSPQQNSYIVPAAANAPPKGQVGTVAHESNGMVYYYDSSQLYADTGNTAVAGLPSVGYGMPITPSPDPGFYYPQAPQTGMYYTQ